MLTYHRFADVDPAAWLTLLNDAIVRRHMPLAGEARWTAANAAAWAAGKDGQWAANGYGPWALKLDGTFVGWGGFQKDGGEADFGLVLLPHYWGQGPAVFRALMRRGLRELPLGPVSVLLPLSRTHTRSLERLGFQPSGEVTREGQRFRKFSLRAVPAPETIEGAIGLRWPREAGVIDNWGDKLSPALVELLADRPVIHSSLTPPEGATAYMVIGSGIARARKRNVVWGMGFIEAKAKMPIDATICSVRGPLTRGKLLEGGLDCPRVYGDPAVLLPLFFRPRVTPTQRIGVIRHWRERFDAPLAGIDDERLLFIDICGGLAEVVEQIVSCERIISGSLHGLIAAHAYGVPATWVKHSNAPLGDGFKFRDYFASLGIRDVQPLVEDSLTIGDVDGALVEIAPHIDIGRLIDACPLVTAERRALLHRQREAIYPRMPPARLLRAAVGSGQRLDPAGSSPALVAPPAGAPPIPLLSSRAFSAMVARRDQRETQLRQALAATWTAWGAAAGADWAAERAELFRD